jgi:hypothetical protein
MQDTRHRLSMQSRHGNQIILLKGVAGTGLPLSGTVPAFAGKRNKAPP